MFVFLSLPNLASKEILSSTQAYRKGEDIPIFHCVFRYSEAVVKRTGDGKNPPIRIYPRKGEDFFFVFRKLPHNPSLTEKEIQNFFPKKEQITKGNHLITKTKILPEANLWIRATVRKRKENLLDFFLSCD